MIPASDAERMEMRAPLWRARGSWNSEVRAQGLPVFLCFA